MENFNKNWLLILLVAVVFGTLGFLLGRVTGHGGHHPMQNHHSLMKEVQIEVSPETGDFEEGTVTMDTIIKDGKQIIIKEVKKIKKED